MGGGSITILRVCRICHIITFFIKIVLPYIFVYVVVVRLPRPMEGNGVTQIFLFMHSGVS